MHMQPGEVTQLLHRASAGDKNASALLIQKVYADLHRLAAQVLSGERPGHILQPTALVNETYMKLFGNGEQLRLNDRNHFFAVAATQMRRILVDDARSRHARKREGIQIELEEALFMPAGRHPDLVELDDALKELEEDYPENAKVVELRYFGGYTNEETAHILETNVAKVRRDWEFARAWLFSRLAKK
jgi:RNA polymerase sigma factor (TIGR02999 family)